MPESLQPLNIIYYSRNNNLPYVENGTDNRYDRLRREPSLKDLMCILHGACILLIAGLKPIRIGELQDLKYDCIYFKKGDGFWLEHKNSKSGIHNILPKNKKPIPKITATAINIIKEFNDIAKQCNPNVNKKISDYLFYGLAYHRTDLHATIKDSAQIGTCIEIFTDYTNLPTDAYGRRWYVNIHELRKSFLLMFFWTFKFSSLDSCRWIAGHRDPDHVFRYIEENMPGEEMCEIEAEYATQQLKLFNSDHNLSEIENIANLDSDVCIHFNVNRISEIPEEDLTEWIELSIINGKYIIEAFDINSTKKHLNARVAFRIRDEN